MTMKPAHVYILWFISVCFGNFNIQHTGPLSCQSFHPGYLNLGNYYTLDCLCNSFFSIFLWMYRNSTDACVIISTPFNFIKWFISVRFFPRHAIRIFSRTVPLQTDTSNTMLNKCGPHGHHCLLHGRESLRSLPLSTIRLWDFYIWLLL